MLNVIMLNSIMMNVIILSVVAPSDSMTREKNLNSSEIKKTFFFCCQLKRKLYAGSIKLLGAMLQEPYMKWDLKSLLLLRRAVKVFYGKIIFRGSKNIVLTVNTN